MPLYITEVQIVANRNVRLEQREKLRTALRDSDSQVVYAEVQRHGLVAHVGMTVVGHEITGFWAQTSGGDEGGVTANVQIKLEPPLALPSDQEGLFPDAAPNAILGAINTAAARAARLVRERVGQGITEGTVVESGTMAGASFGAIINREALTAPCSDLQVHPATESLEFAFSTY